MDFNIRAATKEDSKDIFRMIMELAVYEKIQDQVTMLPQDLESHGFCQNRLFECYVAEVPEESKSREGFTTVGYAVYYFTYNPFKGQALFLEHLYVMPEFRGKGIGKSLLSKVAEVGTEMQCEQIQLLVSNWNTPTLRCQRSSGPHCH